MEKKEIRLLKADEIECRVGTLNEKGLSLLLYKAARADMKVLDETFGLLGWKRSHQLIDGNLFCTVDIWDEEKKEWISKQDVGTAGSNEKTEPEKSRASDSFKRACVSVGVGRELYSAPFIWIPSERCRIERGRDGKLICKDKFTVDKIEYNENREITDLKIRNQKGIIVYQMRKAWKPVEPEAGLLTVAQLEFLNSELDRTCVDMETVLNRYHLTAVSEMTPEIYQSAINSLAKTKSAA